MGKPSKEQEILELFLDYPSKYWHFSEIKKKVSLPDNKISKWLKKFIKEDLIKRIKPKGKMPYYLANYNSPHYSNTKKLFALNKFYECGLLDYLSSLKKTKTIILFGSLSRGDWYKESDIDLFIHGDVDNLDLGKYQFKLHREFQLFNSKNKTDLKKFGPGLLRNIIKGINIRGEIPLEMIKNASISE